MDSYEKLTIDQLPPPKAFYSKLKDECITYDEYEQCLQYWTQYKMKTIKDYLIFYNSRDDVPFLQRLNYTGLTLVSIYSWRQCPYLA